MAKINLIARRRARRFALQAIYQWQLAQQPLDIIETQFMQQEEWVNVDVPFFQEILHNVVQKHEQWDEQFQPFLDRALNQVDPVELAILRMGAYELVDHLEIPYRVILNETIELAKMFGGQEGHRYVNGILNQLARKLRVSEIHVI